MGIVHHRKGDSEGNWAWDGVETEHYDAPNDPNAGATKQVLIGPADGAPNFALRYFTLPPHGRSNLDHHAHDHGVMVVAGQARVLLGDRYEEIGPGDIIYIPGWEKHQFENLTDTPFTFLCIVPPKTAQPDQCLVQAPAEQQKG
jgi:quercetin dioxygenase-like cupin family protein